MKFLKFSLALAVLAFLWISFSSCKKEKTDPSIKKEQLTGKWSMIIQQAGSATLANAELKGSGAMTLDVSPYDGIPDLIFLWSTENNNFNAHLGIDSIPNAYEFKGTIDPVTLDIAGEFRLNDPQSPQTAVFTMDKE